MVKDRKKQQREYREENKEEIARKAKIYYKKNKKEINQKTKKYKEKNKEKIKKYREENKEKLLKKAKIYRKKNKEKISQRTKKYHKTPNGWASQSWNALNCSTKKRKHMPPNFTFKEFKDWIFVINGKKFKRLYNAWKKSNYDIYLRPSINRLDDYKPYTFKNMELVTWKINLKKSHKCEKCLKARIKVGKDKGRPIYQYSLDGKFIKEFPSSCEASKILRIHKAGILSVCNKKFSQANSFLWRFKDKVKSKDNLYIKNLKIIPRTKKVVRFTKDGIFSKEYNSITEASIDNNINVSCISNVCSKRILTSRGFIWRLKSEVKNKQKIYINKKKLIIGKPVIQYDINLKFIQRFNNITKASKITGKNRDIISNICHKKQKSSCGFIWRFD